MAITTLANQTNFMIKSDDHFTTLAGLYVPKLDTLYKMKKCYGFCGKIQFC
ncbi:hypothetical protein [Moraxella lacunata]|uniref:hypothetical protein n=1 Tax=Moraxella lacunata TaxID=477 RepID=UPI003EDF71B8